MPEDRDVSKNPESGQVTLMHLFLGIAFCMPIAAATTHEAFRRRNAVLFSRRTLGACTRRRDCVFGLEVRENSVVEMPAVFQAGAKCGCRGFIRGRVALDCCWGYLRS